LKNLNHFTALLSGKTQSISMRATAMITTCKYCIKLQ